MTPAIRRATVADAPALARLLTGDGHDADAGRLTARLRDLPEGHAVLVAERGHRVVGFVHVHLDPSLVAGWRATLAGLAVDPAAADDGVADALLASAESWSREHGCHRLDVRAATESTAAQTFYRDHRYGELTETVLAKDLVIRRQDVRHP